MQVYQWPSITQPELRNGQLQDGSPLPRAVRLTYEEKNTYKTTAKAFGLMDDFRVRLLSLVAHRHRGRTLVEQAGVPRMAYRGVVAFMFGKTRVYLAPPPNWTDYDPKWS